MNGKKHIKKLIAFSASLLLSGCYHYEAHDGPPHYYRDVSKIPNAVPRYLPKSRYGNRSTYYVDGRIYHVLPSAAGYNATGMISWYGSLFDGRGTSTHERYNPYGMTAASTVLPIPCFVRVTNLRNGRWIIVKVNDRGPFVSNRIMDLSYAGAVKLGYIGTGTTFANVRTVGPTDDSGVSDITTNPYAPTHETPTYYYHARAARISETRLYLQLGVFNSRYHAERLQEAARSLTHKRTLIHTIRTTDGYLLYRVELGPLRDTEELMNVEYTLEDAHLGKPIRIISS